MVYLKTKAVFYLFDVGEEKDRLMQEEEEEDQTLENTYIQAERVKSFNFPTYAPPNVKDDMVRCGPVFN